jgi:hypothetical protein
MTQSLRLALLFAVTAAVAGCSDAATAPAPSSGLQPATADNSKGGGTGGSITYTTTTTTVPFAATACNGEAVTGQSVEQILVANYTSASTTTSASLVSALDNITATGATTGAKYKGKQLNASVSYISTTVIAGFQANIETLLTGTKGVPNTYLSAIAIYAIGTNGQPILQKAYYNAGCTSAKAHEHDHDHDDDR